MTRQSDYQPRIWERAQEYMRDKGPVSSRAIAKHLDVAVAEVSTVLNIKSKRGLIARVMPDNDTQPLRWQLVAAAVPLVVGEKFRDALAERAIEEQETQT